MGTKGVPAADYSDPDQRSGHSFPKANRGTSMNSDDRVPSLLSARLSHT